MALRGVLSPTRGTKVKGEDDTVPAREEPKPRRGDKTHGQVIPNGADACAESVGKIPELQEHRRAGAIRGGFTEEGALKTGFEEWVRFCQPETSPGEVCQAEGQQGKGTEAGKSATGLGVVSSYNVRMESQRRGWRGRLAPAPEVWEAAWDGFGKQEGTTDGS